MATDKVGHPYVSQIVSDLRTGTVRIKYLEWNIEELRQDVVDK